MVLFCGPGVGGGWLLVVPVGTMVFFGLGSPLSGLGGVLMGCVQSRELGACTRLAFGVVQLKIMQLP